MTLPQNVLLHGSAEPLPEVTQLRAGPFSMIYTAGEIRYVQLAGREVLRRLYVAVRDENWFTIPSRAIKTNVEVHPDSFRISVHLESKLDAIDFYWKIGIVGEPQGRIIFKAKGVARSTFLRNRVGLCVLFGAAEYKGTPCVINGVDGKKYKGVFPELISSHQPFQQIQRLSCEPLPGLPIELRLRGDIFEMEDQRNWGDASFKIYSTPLELRIPVRVEKGTVISQSATFKLARRRDVSIPKAVNSKSQRKLIRITINSDKESVLPRIGLSFSGLSVFSNAKSLQRLRGIGFSHLRVDVRLQKRDYQEQFEGAIRQARELAIPLEIALFVSSNYKEELESLAEFLRKRNPPVCTVLIFDSQSLGTDPNQLKFARVKLAAIVPSALFGGGTDAYFAELNRSRASFRAFDLTSFPYTPQVHSTDAHSLAENLNGLGATIHSAKRLADEMPISVSPITFKPRYRADRRPHGPVNSWQPHPEYDSRQRSLFGAGLTVGILKQVAEAGIYSATCFETTGQRGLLEADLPDSSSGKNSMERGHVYPLFHVFAEVLAQRTSIVVSTTSSSSNLVQSLALKSADKMHLFLANLSGRSLMIRIDAPGLKDARVKSLDESNVAIAMTHPDEFSKAKTSPVSSVSASLDLSLKRWSVARVSWSHTCA